MASQEDSSENLFKNIQNFSAVLRDISVVSVLYFGTNLVFFFFPRIDNILLGSGFKEMDGLRQEGDKV